MKILPLHKELVEYLTTRGLVRKFEKQSRLFIASINHPSLETELLEPKHLRIFSFRLDHKYRVIFIFRDKETIEAIDINNHYR
ncbi:MAG: hypothetical protein G01um101472_182 [Parcubacteria group bacterium Gr01-1014_72]|nr:MAG: hypothetical protein G01um101472_182 [Parcubacteria group bacterium Gr01-1014_72]